MRLLVVELQRFAWRRSFRFFGLISVLSILVTAVIVFFNSSKQMTAFGDDRFHLADLLSAFQGTSVPLIILGLAFGAAFIGAEWGAGTITTLLTWEPRRLRVMVAKALAVALGVFIFVVLTQAFLALVMWPVAVLRGTTEGVDREWFLDAFEVVGRGAFVAGMFALLGFGIASIARNATAAQVIGFAYFAIGEAILRALRPQWQPWLIGDNAAAVVTASPQQIFFTSRPLSACVLTLVAYCAGAVGLASAFFRARDVT